MTDVETLILARLTQIESQLITLSDFKNRVMGVIVVVSGIGTFCGSLIVVAINNLWKN